jgi:uncharacterized membrane protein YgdD (TMEM256/DUF423 family)
VSSRLCILFGGLFGAAAVAMAAVAAHGLGGLSSTGLAAVEAAVQMQIWHSIALIALGAWLPRGGVLSRGAGLGFIVGTALFCAGVYGHELASLPVGPLAPIGGTILILSWLLLAGSALRRDA